MSEATRATVTGPVTGGTHGWAFGAPVVDLVRAGYRQDEFFLEGVATRYAPAPGTDIGRDGRWVVQPAGRAPYKTRLYVLRPEDPGAFNGTVVLAWNNVSAGYENFGGGDSAELLEGGYAFVAASVQRVGLHGVANNPMGLAAWDPERYGSLSISSDDYSFDIFTQAANAIAPGRVREPVDPMGGLEVRQIIAHGASQSAGRLATYVNAIQPLAGVIDGFILLLYFGRGAPLEVGEAVFAPSAPGNDEAPRLPAMVESNLIRDDLDVPVMVVNTECEAPACYAVRQPDTDRFRYWESAGTSHIYFQAMQGAAPRIQRDFGFPIPVQRGINEVPTAPVADAALHHMRVWLQGGSPPPIQPRIEFRGDPPEVVRDDHGIARGGIRLPQVEVPIAQNSAIPLSEDFSNRLGGSCVPFAPEAMRALYGSNEEYLARFEEATRSAEKAGVIMPRDADALIIGARDHLPFEKRAGRLE